MGTGSFPGVESGWGVTLTPHPLLVPRSKNRVELYLYFPQGGSWPVKKGENNAPRFSFRNAQQHEDTLTLALAILLITIVTHTKVLKNSVMRVQCQL
jgi:hypothetical protein